MLPAISLEAALGIAAGALLGAVVMLGLWLRARSTVGHVMEDLRSLRQLARRERSDLERQVEGLQRGAQQVTLRVAETEESLDALKADYRELQEAHTGLRAAYLEAMGGGPPPSVQLRTATSPLPDAIRGVADEIGSLAAESAHCRDAVQRCRELMDDLMHDMHRAIDLGRRLSPSGDPSGGFFQALEEGLVSVDSAMQEVREQMEHLVARAASLTQHGASMTAVAHSHAETVRSLTSQWQRLESASVAAPGEPSA